MDSPIVSTLLRIKSRCLPPVFNPPSCVLQGTSDSVDDAGSVTGAISLSTRTWSVVPDAKIHYSVYSVASTTLRADVGGAVDEAGGGGKGAAEKKGKGGHEEEEKLVSQGFYNGPISLSAVEAVAGTYRIRALTLHPSLLPSPQVSALYTLVADTRTPKKVTPIRTRDTETAR
jgi:hypothetical protein